jgi:NADPH:quinone reductase-like Zn-dependent oxidoreductase
MAEFVSVPAGNVARIAAGLSFAEATAVAHSFPVALTLLRRTSAVAGDTILVSGAGGAVGSATVQMARFIGARVIAAVGSPAGADWLRSLPEANGPDAIVEYGPSSDLAAAVRDAAPDGVSLYVETASDPDVWDAALKTLARRARVAIIGAHAGPIVGLNTNWLFRQRVTIFGCSGSTVASFREAIELAGEGRIVPNIDSVQPLSEAGSAYTRLMQRKNQGKIVLRVADDLDPR